MSSPFDYFTYRNGILSVDSIPLHQVAEQIQTPVYVYSSEAFLDPLNSLKAGLKSVDHLVCFAVKANSNISILHLLGKAGAGMDLVSGGELYRARKAGVPSDRIVFSGVGKTPEEITTALQTGILSFNVESVAELALINEMAQAARTKAPVCLRFNPDVNAKTHPYISTGLKKNKFGINWSEIKELLRNFDQFKGIHLKGLSIHIGSQLLSLSPLEDAFRKTRNVLIEMNQHLPSPLSMIDLGGGVGIQYKKNEKSPKIETYCKLILKYFGKPSSELGPMKVVLEPGRFLAGNAGVLITKVLYVKERGKKRFLIVDAGMNDLMRPALYGSFHDIVPIQQKLNRAVKMKTDIVGPVCESSDCFAHDRPFPKTAQSGDLLAILSAGAYGFTMASSYNTRPRPAEVLIHENQVQVIRQRETYDDLLRGEILRER